MELHPNEDAPPGGQIITNNSRLLVSVPVGKGCGAKRGASTFYLFICPIFSFTTQPVQSNSNEPNQAPFILANDGKRVTQAYFIKHGQVHHGYQVCTRVRLNITVYLDLNLRYLQSTNGTNVYELVQLLLFDNQGNHEPMDIQFLVVRHPPESTPTCRHLDSTRPPLEQPIPYFQSPLPLELDPLAVFPEHITIGNEFNFFRGRVFDLDNEPLTLSFSSFEAKPYLTFQTAQYLRLQHRVTFYGPFWSDLLASAALNYIEPESQDETKSVTFIQDQSTQTDKEIVCNTSLQTISATPQEIFQDIEEMFGQDYYPTSSIDPFLNQVINMGNFVNYLTYDGWFEASSFFTASCTRPDATGLFQTWARPLASTGGTGGLWGAGAGA